MAFDPKTLKAQVDAALKRIPTMQDCEKLRALHSNVHRQAGLDDLDREALDEAVLQRIKIACPKIAKELVGPRDAQGRAFLESFFEALKSNYDLSGNTLRNGVKVGGYMINGSRYVDLYINYKTANGINLGIAWIQKTAADTPFILVMKRHVRNDSDEADYREQFDDEEKARSAYVHELVPLLKSK